jgi:threonine aldolase
MHRNSATNSAKQDLTPHWRKTIVQAAAIDLRSDTVTRPSPAMRKMIAAAPVGDDQYGEDPTVNQLQQRVAALLGKQAALFVPTGTMANQIALRTLTRPGDDVIVSRESHAVWHEAGAGAANAGVQFTDIGARGTFTAEEVGAAIKPRGHALYPPTTLIEIENTHNRSGGIVFPQDEVVRICAAARERKIATFLDGARLWNVAVASKRSLAELAAPFDLVSVALSKGLGAPAGSLLAASSEVIASALRHRRMLGGAMRQAGILAAAGLYALDHNLERLAEDHANALRIGERLARCRHVDLDLTTVQTNILVFRLRPDAPDAASVVNQARARGVLIFAFGPRTVRAVTHLDVSAEQCARAAEILAAIVEPGA